MWLRKFKTTGGEPHVDKLLESSGADGRQLLAHSGLGRAHTGPRLRHSQRAKLGAQL